MDTMDITVHVEREFKIIITPEYGLRRQFYTLEAKLRDDKLISFTCRLNRHNYLEDWLGIEETMSTLLRCWDSKQLQEFLAAIRKELTEETTIHKT